MRQILPAFIMLLLAATAISCRPTHETEKSAARQTITHPNGIVLRIGETLTASQTQAGYIIKPKDPSPTRFPLAIEVRLEDGPEPSGQSKSLVVDGTKINYRIVRESGDAGAGGSEYTVTAWRPCLGKQILAIQRMQAEMEQELDFQKAFQIIAHASCDN